MFSLCKSYQELEFEVDEAERQMVEQYGAIKINKELSILEQHLNGDMIAQKIYEKHAQNDIPEELQAQIPVSVDTLVMETAYLGQEVF